MRLTGWIVAAALVMAASLGSAQAPPAKLALVIGNADYNGDGRIDVSEAGATASEAAGFVPDLRNAGNDAEGLRVELTRIGFDVTFQRDADRTRMLAAVAEFDRKVRAAPPDALAIIYYTGHAFEADGLNYLVPVRAKLPDVDYGRLSSSALQVVLDYEFVPAPEILDLLREPGSRGLNLVIFDASRNNPFYGRLHSPARGIGGGLADVRTGTRRTIVAFSTAPGSYALDGEGLNSPYAAALIKWIGRPGIDVVEMLQNVSREVEAATAGMQRPWISASATERVCLAGCGPEPAAPSAPGTSSYTEAELRRRIAQLEAQLAARDAPVAPRPATPTSPPAIEDRAPRLALVFGNADYKLDDRNTAFGKLKNPVNDAALVAHALEAPSVGFKVMLRTDRTLAEMEDDVRDFADAVQKAGDAAGGEPPTVVIWYSGHGQQSDTRNYLIPLGGAFQRHADLQRFALDMNWVFATLQEAGAGVKLIFLDACRDNGLPLSGVDGHAGLARMHTPRNTLLVFSTAPDQTATDGIGPTSPFAAAFADAASRPLAVEQSVVAIRKQVVTATRDRQTPYDESSLMQSFSFQKQP